MHPLGGARSLGAAALLAVAALAACGGSSKREPAATKPGGARPAPAAVPAAVDVQQGLATWYGVGRRTASGERFDKHAMTAAHRTLPFGTRVRVTNQRNGRSVIVRINDRGPFARGRIIDVTEGAAVQLDMKRDGVVPVKVERLR
ncbi:MAG TPA: septal ring lytic transglycosylase RlpA family protein [Kofleriaceae bacterium]|nr:septal ring lytic transglycosylase RlpA family protein [Kofleriaceae bacterium]